jgi:hypothetical protein
VGFFDYDQSSNPPRDTFMKIKHLIVVFWSWQASACLPLA